RRIVDQFHLTFNFSRKLAAHGNLFVERDEIDAAFVDIATADVVDVGVLRLLLVFILLVLVLIFLLVLARGVVAGCGRCIGCTRSGLSIRRRLVLSEEGKGNRDQ